MQPSTPPSLAPQRIIALLLIAAAVLGLAYVRFEHRTKVVSVPTGAHAGQLRLNACTYATENGRYRADCGTLIVPENRHDSSSRLIALPVTRIHARSTHPGPPIFRLEGGPGLTNMKFPAASRFAANHDIVLVGYRGVDGAAKLDCPEVTSARQHARDFLSETSFRADATAFKACADRLRHTGFDLGGYTLPERVDDLDAARRALGYERVDIVSESAGTRTALMYAWRYPNRIHRSVMIGVNPPGGFLWDAKTTDEQIRRYAALCADNSSCRGRTHDLAASLQSASKHVPSHWFFLPVKQGNVKAAAFFGLMNATTDGAGPLAAPMTIDTLLSADTGDGGGAWLLSVMAQLTFPRAQVWGDVAAVGRSDAAYARRFFATHADRGSTIGGPGTDLIWAGGRLLGAWPASPDENEYTRVRDSNVETLLIGGNLDFATPPQKATRELLPHLPRGRQVVLSDLGHTDDFWTYQPSAGTRLITTFLDSGRVDQSLYTHHAVDFRPSMSPSAIAKIILGSMLGLAALTVIALVWMWCRVRTRGCFGHKAGALLRTAFPLVLGLGGWFLGAMITLTAWPTVPLDDQLLGVVAIGTPVGLGIYLAWVDSAWPAKTRLAGLAAALAGSIAGATLAFHAIDGLLAVLTTIVGATAGANLLLITLAISWERHRSMIGSLPTIEREGYERRRQDGAGPIGRSLTHSRQR